MGEKKIKVILDANVYVSFFLTRGETSSEIFDLWKNDAFTVYISEEIIAEIYRVFHYPKILKRLTHSDHEALVMLLEDHAERVLIVENIHFPHDLDDAKYLAAARACTADYLVTGDKKHLLLLKKFGTTRIVSPKEFVEVLQKSI